MDLMARSPAQSGNVIKQGCWIMHSFAKYGMCSHLSNFLQRKRNGSPSRRIGRWTDDPFSMLGKMWSGGTLWRSRAWRGEGTRS